MNPTQFQLAFKDWVDEISAQCIVAEIIGIVRDNQNYSTDVKWAFWSDNTISRVLSVILEGLALAGVLEFRNHQGLEFRWNANFNLDDIAEETEASDIFLTRFIDRNG